MRRLTRLTCAAAGLTSCALLGGCEVILGINDPLDREADSGEESVVSNAGHDGMSTVPLPDGGASHDVESGIASPYAWAEWPMPNPPSTGLPNPQTYDTATAAGVVVDMVTGLAWQRSVDETSFVWTDAVSYCDRLSLEGGGWRLPARIELLSIVDFTQNNPLIEPTAFPATPSEQFWTSSLVAGNPSNAWSVDFGFGAGLTYDEPVTGSHRVRCVRINRATVYDAKTKLTWQQVVPTSAYPWADAMHYCKKLDLDGNGWRLPSVNELQTLVDETRRSPAIDPAAFPSTPVDYFWTSSNVAGFSSFGWTIYFAYGSAHFFDVVQPHQVRCVR
jgi:hypothetical protein